MAPSPTDEQFTAYQALVQYFNERLFGGALPAVLLNFSRKGKRTRGFFAPNRWQKATAFTHEISLNPALLKERSPIEIASTLVHELCHLWQFVFGRPSRAGYHNREWAEKMEAVGLMPSDTGQVGGQRTGQQMTHYVIDGGPFEQAFQALPSEYLLPWLCYEMPRPARPSRLSKVKYTCPGCHQNAWGKPDLRLWCPDCQGFFLAADGIPPAGRSAAIPQKGAG